MRKPLVILSASLISVFGCAQKDSEITKTRQLNKSVFVANINTELTQCSVIFSYKDDPSVRFSLEEDALVACNGVHAQKQVSGEYMALISRTYDLQPIRITLIRPQEGTTSVSYVDAPTF